LISHCLIRAFSIHAALDALEQGSPVKYPRTEPSSTLPQADFDLVVIGGGSGSKLPPSPTAAIIHTFLIIHCLSGGSGITKRALGYGKTVCIIDRGVK